MVRRLVGIDLGVSTAHTVAVLDENAEVIARRRARPCRDSLEAVEQTALKDTPAGTVLEVIVEELLGLAVHPGNEVLGHSRPGP